MGENLQQGDIIGLSRLQNSGLESQLSALPDRTFCLVVLTQTCDMVRGRVKTDHVALAPAVPLSEVLSEKVATLQTLKISKLAGICGKNQKGKLIEFLKKLLNNNEPHYFYLHEEHGFGLREPMCVFLRRPIVLSIEPNYSSLVDARELALNEEFRAKLGWLVGSIYSRVATQDWPEKDIDAFIDNVLTDACGWEDFDRLNAAEKALNKTGTSIPTEKVALAKYIQGIHVPTKSEEILNSVRDVMKRVELSGKSSEEITKDLCNKLETNANFKRLTSK